MRETNVRTTRQRFVSAREIDGLTVVEKSGDVFVAPPRCLRAFVVEHEQNIDETVHAQRTRIAERLGEDELLDLGRARANIGVHVLGHGDGSGGTGKENLVGVLL